MTDESDPGRYTCQRCGFSGKTRSGQPPVSCAKCRSAYWPYPRKNRKLKAPKGKLVQIPSIADLAAKKGLALPPPDFYQFRKEHHDASPK